MTDNLVTTTIPPKYSFLQDLNIGLDILLIGTWVAAALVYAFTVGRKKGPILLLSTYAGLAVSAVVTKLNFSPSQTLAELQQGEFFSALVFLVVFIIAFVSLIRIIKRHIRIHTSRNSLVILAALEMGAFLSSMGSLMPTDFTEQISGFAGLLFATSWTHALWLILPLVIVLVGEHNDRVLNRV